MSKDFSEGAGGALRKNPFHGKMWIFSGTTQWIYLLLKEGGGGGAGVEGLDLKCKKDWSQVV